ncbi:MAG: nucleotidyltransferase family protein [Chthoniobacterales bacterium]
MPRKVGAVILAAGGSRRLRRPKQLLVWHGETLLRRAVRAAHEGGCARIAVVTGAIEEPIAAELESGPAVALVHNPEWERGLGSSVRRGVRHLRETDALVLLACDQPFVSGAIVSALISQWDASGHPIVASRYADTLGVPALFDRSCFADLLRLPDDEGAKSIIRSSTDPVGKVDFPEGAIDIDTPADYAQLCERPPPSL